MYRRWPWPSEDCIKVIHCYYDSQSGYVIIRPQHGEHYRIELFEGDNFSGQRVELCEDCPFLRVKGLTKNCVNSIKVYGDGAWVSRVPPFLCLIESVQGCCSGSVEVFISCYHCDTMNGWWAELWVNGQTFFLTYTNPFLSYLCAFPTSTAGWCTRSPTTEAACTWWREETFAATRNGRRRTPTSSQCAGWQTTSKPVPCHWQHDCRDKNATRRGETSNTVN